MKKNIKKCFALLLAVVMTLTMAMTVFAAATTNSLSGGETDVAVEDASIKEGTIKILNGTGKYQLFKIASARIENGNNTYSYTLDSKYDAVFTAILGNEWTWNTILTTADKARELASALESAVQDKSETSISAGVAQKVDLGYYLIVEKGNTNNLTRTQPILVAVPQVSGNKWQYDIEVAPKASSVDFEKKIVSNDREGNTEDSRKWVDTSAEEIGDTIDYVTKSTIPQYDWSKVNVNDVQYKITDTPSTGLTINNNSVHVYVSNDSVADVAENKLPSSFRELEPDKYTFTNGVTAENGTTVNGFTVDFTGKYGNIKDYKYVYIFFSAELNKDAVIAPSANPNNAKLTYSNSYIDASKTTDIPDEVKSYTFKFDLLKTAKGDTTNTALEGAEFTLKDDKDNSIQLIKVSDKKKYRIATAAEIADNDVAKTTTIVSSNGAIEIIGLDEGTYKLKETKAPAGYKLMETEITFKIQAGMENTEYSGAYVVKNMDKEDTPDWPDNKITVEDEKGLTLPGTGGIGTTLFTFGGLALILVAGVMFIVYTRKQKKQS